MNKRQLSRRSTYRVETKIFKQGTLSKTYRVYTHPDQPDKGRRLLLIHGAGVGGRDTWQPLIDCLTNWREILVPDLRGAGDTHWNDRVERAFDVNDLVEDLSALLNYLDWSYFDLGGYSLGGLVAMLLKQRHSSTIGKQYLFESAILDRENWLDTLSVSDHYVQVADQIHNENSALGIKRFLDTVSPYRRVTPEVERITMERLSERAKGFAFALQSVSGALSQIDREGLLAAQGDVSSVIGGLTVDPMHQLHRGLADRLPNWHYFLMPGTDHSLPYQKPRQLAKLMDSELNRFVSASNTH